MQYDTATLATLHRKIYNIPTCLDLSKNTTRVTYLPT